MNTTTSDDGGIRIQLEPELSAAEFVDVLKRSTLAERRPVNDHAVVDGMLRHADLIATARTPIGCWLVWLDRSLIFTIARICLISRWTLRFSGAGSADG